MTLCTCYGHAQPRHTGCCDAINNVKVSILGIDQAAFIAGHYIAMKSACNSLLDGCLWKEIARKLLNGKLVERHVCVEGVDYPFTPQPHVT